MRYVASGPFLLDCDMHRPHHRKPVMDSLLAFWPGLQVLWGDIEPAASTHDLLYYVNQKHNFLPEAFNIDMKSLVWANHPLRPEFAESTYFLYKATGDPYYLDIGKSIIGSLEGYARVPCGFAAVKDVRTKHHEDRFATEGLLCLLAVTIYANAIEAHICLDTDTEIPLVEQYTTVDTYSRAGRFNAKLIVKCLQVGRPIVSS